MHKEKKDKLRNYYIALSIVALFCAGGWKAYCHFAKTSTVEELAKVVVKGQEAATKSMTYIEERLAIGTHNERVHRQEEEVTRAKNRLRFEKKQGLPTREEEEDVTEQEKRLEEVVEQRRELIEEYKSKK